MLGGITRQARELSGADLALLALPGEDGRGLTVTYAEAMAPPRSTAWCCPPGQSLSGHVLATGEPVTSGDFADEERAPSRPAAR